MADVLVVKDDPVTSRLLAAVLRQGGFQPIAVTSAREALGALERQAVLECLPGAFAERSIVRLLC